MSFHNHLESNIIFWMTSIFLTQLTMSVSPAAPAVHEALWKLRSCWRCNDMHVVWLRTAMGFGCCYKNRDQRWMIQFDEITDVYGYLRIVYNLIILDLDWSCWNHESLFDDVQAPPISHELSFQFASAVLLFNLIQSPRFLDLTIVWLRMLKQLTPERTSFQHCWIGPSTFQSFTVSTIGTLPKSLLLSWSSWEVPGKERCIWGSPKPGNDTESARNGGKGRSIFLSKWKSLTIRLSYAIIICQHMSYSVLVFCFLNLSHNVTPPLNPNAIELVEDVSIMFSIFCCLCTGFFAFGVPTMQTLEANDSWPSVARWSR